MIKRNQSFLNRMNIFLDFLLVFIAYLLASWLRLYVLRGNRGNMALSYGMLMAAVLYSVVLVFSLMLAGFYNTQRLRRLGWRLAALFVTVSAAIIVASAMLFLFRLEDFSRGVLLLFYLLTLGLLGGKCICVRLMMNRLRAEGFNIKHEAVIGNGPMARQYTEDVAAAPELGIKIEEMIEPNDTAAIRAVLICTDIDEVVIALEVEDYGRMVPLIADCEKYGVKYLVLPFYNDIIPTHPVIETVGNSKLIDMRANRLDNIGWAIVKRGFDIIISAFALIMLSPLLLVIAVGVKLSSPGPILFRQTRVGYRRREFQMLKFRSMRINDLSDTAWSAACDDRRTAFGALIRKTSLDELPQLWNVLRGDMSLVGPRPELPHFVEQFREEIPLYMVKHQVKPGITGWAQVNGYRGDTSIKKRIEMDLWYIDHWSVGLDMKILLKTFPKAMINSEQVGQECKRA